MLWSWYHYCSLALLILATSGVTKASSSKNWTEWSTCSRTCDGGISSRQKCSQGESRGESRKDCSPLSQHKICNMHPCAKDAITATGIAGLKGPLSFRDEQCAQNNDVLHKGNLYQWVSYLNPTEPCALWCQTDDDLGLRVKFSNQVIDGTRCHSQTLNVCIRGGCKNVGCDLMVDSEQKVDKCGICGGDGSQCQANKVSFVWFEIALSHCSTPCGGGYRMARYVCQNNITKETVQDELCNVLEKPEPKMAPCNQQPCPARWEVEDWQVCSQSCGRGFRTRIVKCIIDKDGNKEQVPDNECPDLRPPSREACNTNDCPQWFAGIWSDCNVKCGQGLQHRNVICRDGGGYPSNACNFAVKPVSRQPCNGHGLDCVVVEEDEISRQKKGAATSGIPSSDDDIVKLEDNGLTNNNGWMKLDSGTLKAPTISRKTNTVVTDTENIMENNDEELSSDHTESTLIVGSTDSFSEETSTPPQAMIQIPSEPSFIVEEWGPCSSPCGEGIRERKVQCKIFLEFSKTVATLPDHECPGPKPATTEICFSGLCDTGVKGILPPVSAPLASPLKIKNVQGDEKHRLESIADNMILDNAKYQWNDVGFTQCSESCLGGLQESKIICVDVKDNPVSPMHCNMAKRPEVIVRTCNDHPCPPRWNVSDFSSCSKTCGGGIQTRSVTCIQEVRHGGNNILRVDDSFCPQPPPIVQQFCNVIDCKPGWKKGSWSKCSKKCGNGFKVRDVICQQLLALGELANKPDRDCPIGKPEARESCNIQPCLFSDISRIQDEPQPLIKANVNQMYEQRSLNQNIVKLKVGGQATVFKGTKLKIRCPVKKFKRSLIQWAKGDKMVPTGSQRRKSRFADSGMKGFVTKKGSLRIPSIGYQDAGIYTCMAQASSATIDIVVKPRDSNDVWGPDNDLSKSSWDYEKKFTDDKDVYGVVKNVPEDYFFATTPRSTSYNPYDDYSIRYNEVDSDWNKDKNHFEEINNDIGWKPFSDSPKNLERPQVTYGNWKRHLDPPGAMAAIDKNTKNDEEIKIDWSVSEWSKCSHTCGKNGTQIRKVECVAIKGDKEQTIPKQICNDAGFKEPIKIQSCGISQCPRWFSQAWTPCHDSKCIAKRTGFQTRDVICSIDNTDTTVDDKYCEAVLRPRSSQTCFNRRCRAIWKTSQWSQCSVTCGVGQQYRSLECVWKYSSHESAGEACNSRRSTPKKVKQCKEVPCVTTTTSTPNPPMLKDESCRDTSKYCGLIVSFDMCHKDKYKRQCCMSCT